MMKKVLLDTDIGNNEIALTVDRDRYFEHYFYILNN